MLLRMVVEMETPTEEMNRLRERLQFVNVNCNGRVRILQRMKIVEKELLCSLRHPADAQRVDKTEDEEIHAGDVKTLKTENTKPKDEQYVFRWIDRNGEKKA